MLTSKNGENGIRILFSCPQDLPGARRHDAPKIWYFVTFRRSTCKFHFPTLRKCYTYRVFVLSASLPKAILLFLIYMFTLLFFNMRLSKNGENGIRIPFSCLPHSPGARPHDAPKTTSRPPPDAPKWPPRLLDRPRATLICKNQYKTNVSLNFIVNSTVRKGQNILKTHYIFNISDPFKTPPRCPQDASKGFGPSKGDFDM